MPKLVRPEVAHRRAFAEAVFETRRTSANADRWFGLDRASPTGSSWGDAVLHDDVSFGAFEAAQRREAEEGAPRPDDHVPATLLWWVDQDRWLGRLSIRHRLTPFLPDIGGHIGYFVRPSARRQGHATGMLRASLSWARDLGLEHVLVTCDPDNVGSLRAIEANGGLLEDQREGKLRYWIRTSPPPTGAYKRPPTSA